MAMVGTKACRRLEAESPGTWVGVLVLRVGIGLLSRVRGWGWRDCPCVLLRLRLGLGYWSRVVVRVRERI